MMKPRLCTMPRTIRTSSAPVGFRYTPDILTAAEERLLVKYIAELPLKEFEFQGYLGKRRVASFGWRYDFADYSLREAARIPDFLLPVREQAATFAGIRPDEFAHVLVTEYRP